MRLISHTLFGVYRAAESFAANFESYTGIAFSFKEYEDIAIEYSKNKRNMKLWRGHVERKRVIETLFDTKVSFVPYHTAC